MTDVSVYFSRLLISQRAALQEAFFVLLKTLVNAGLTSSRIERISSLVYAL
jgi:hypothetical protein